MNAAPDGKNELAALSDALAGAVESAGRSVVLVNARRRIPASGIAYAHDLVLTADHVVEREEEISVVLPDGKQVSAAIAGRDPARDLALLRLSDALAVPAEQASQPARVGQLALAIGRPESGGLQTSLGVISAVGGPVRTGRGSVLEQYYRSDTIPYPGFSGGPLVNVQGQVLGLNTSGLAMGSLLTIPASIAWQAAASLAAHGHIRRGYLGIRSQTVSLAAGQAQALNRQQESGLLLVGVEEDAPAAKANLMVGDIIVAISGQPVLDHDDLQVHLGSESIGSALPVEILRGGSLSTITVTVGERNGQ